MTFTDAAGTERPYFHHDYNVTADNERAIEIPLAMAFLDGRWAHKGLELGNVLGHYVPVHWPVLDKYEEGEGVINADVMDWRPPVALDWIVAISTVEHVGWDEEPRDPFKAFHAISRLLSWLGSGGAMLITVPMGHHPSLDEFLLDNLVLAQRVSFYERSVGNLWSVAEPKPTPYNWEVPSAVGLWVGEWER